MISFKVKECLFFRSGVYMKYMSIERAGMTRRLGERAVLQGCVLLDGKNFFVLIAIPNTFFSEVYPDGIGTPFALLSGCSPRLFKGIAACFQSMKASKVLTVLDLERNHPLSREAQTFKWCSGESHAPVISSHEYREFFFW